MESINPEELWFKVDEEDLDLIKSYKWFNVKRPKTRYAMAHVYKNGKRTSLYMHNIIMNPPENLRVDHINGDGLDNRKVNLRSCTLSQNSMNQRRVSPTTGYKGVYQKRNGFYAGLELGGKAIHLGVYETATEAAIAYNEGARKYFGEFAYLNNI